MPSDDFTEVGLASFARGQNFLGRQGALSGAPQSLAIRGVWRVGQSHVQIESVGGAALRRLLPECGNLFPACSLVNRELGKIKTSGAFKYAPRPREISVEQLVHDPFRDEEGQTARNAFKNALEMGFFPGKRFLHGVPFLLDPAKILAMAFRSIMASA